MGPIERQVAASRRGGYEDTEFMRANGHELRNPAQVEYLQPSARGVVRSGAYPDFGGQEMHMNDPRYVPQDFALQARDVEDKRQKGVYVGGGTVGAFPGGGVSGGSVSGVTATGALPEGAVSGSASAPMGAPPPALPASFGPSGFPHAVPANLGMFPVVPPAMPLNSGLPVSGYVQYSVPAGLNANVIASTNGYNIGTSVVNNMLVAAAPDGAHVKKEEHEVPFPEQLSDFDERGNRGLKAQIPPLHVQQQINNTKSEAETGESENLIQTPCSRCKKEFVQKLVRGKTTEPKIFKLCNHCRHLQRQRSRRWQKKTKDKEGACRRCGGEIPESESHFVLCPVCRNNLRTRKASRAANGRCVHCSGPIGESIISQDDAGGRRRSASRSGDFKVCERCRENDKIRRTNLEKMGNCNRCAKALEPHDQGRNKVCTQCRDKKKKNSDPFVSQAGGSASGRIAGALSGLAAGEMAPAGYVAVEQAIMPGGPMQSMALPAHEYGMNYSQMLPVQPDMYKPTPSSAAMEQQYSYSRSYPK